MIEKAYRSTFDKINMNAERKSEIRHALEGTVAEKKGRDTMPIIRWVAAVAAVVAVIMCIPQTRSMAFEAADYVTRLFRFADGTKVEIRTGVASTEVSVTVSDEIEYIKDENGRLYFVFDSIHQDITEQVSATDYFRYEKNLSDGGRSVILVGGRKGAYGWIELLFDKSGRYVTNRMYIPEDSGEWQEISMHKEGVPTGNPDYDNALNNDLSAFSNP